ncbi:hypothetical protein PPL_07240 [Heterostelium album PN500]|uniref:Uncharacterized protein n=1 Tax=Heterostelium pallidum (strain ATCC 26659 / Pp 5 / PN500) TaxID=670386 RepID=D3BES5_HETP5|nr:hypothetical protein PPL_07240 [Heterostelium album PN500]EFA80406.1 hypothetical protein PPL_07240 [Heterostelium album PN500]|eukprot:XP_020432526.1 hypothetical protein PPL_07240 [Heterostelium album PN500]
MRNNYRVIEITTTSHTEILLTPLPGIAVNDGSDNDNSEGSNNGLTMTAVSAVATTTNTTIEYTENREDDEMERGGILYMSTTGTNNNNINVKQNDDSKPQSKQCNNSVKYM